MLKSIYCNYFRSDEVHGDRLEKLKAKFLDFDKSFERMLKRIESLNSALEDYRAQTGFTNPQVLGNKLDSIESAINGVTKDLALLKAQRDEVEEQINQEIISASSTSPGLKP